MITVCLFRRILFAPSARWPGRTSKGASNALPRRRARPRRYLLALSLLVCLTAQGCKNKLTVGDFVKAYCTIFSPDNKQVALGVLESKRQERTAEDVEGEDPDNLSPLGDYGRSFPRLMYIHHFPIYLRDAQTGKHQRSLWGHDNAVVSLAYSPDGRLLASGSEDSTVCVWDLRTGKRVHRLKGHGVKGKSVSVISLAFSPDGKTLVSRDDAGVEKRWDVATGKEQSLRGDSPADPMDGRTDARP